MSTASVSSMSASTGVSPARPGAPIATGLVPRLTDPTTLVMIGLLAAAIGLLFHAWFYNQHRHSWGNPDWSHAYLVPLISGYLIWHNREKIERARTGVFWPGLVAVLMGIVSYVFFLVGTPTHLGQGLALVLTIFGVTLTLLGPAVMPWLFLPIAYLGFAITVPELIMNYLTYPLQDLAARGGYVLLNTCGVRCDIQGNVINIVRADLSVFPLNVAEQCSGMRMVIAFLALSVAVALVGTNLWWKRVVLMAMGVPVAVALNIVRVAVLGAVSQVNPDLSTGEAHTFIGTLLLFPGFLLFMGVLVALNKAVPEDAKAPPAPVGRPVVGGAA